MIYLDNSASTRQYDEVTDLMIRLQREEFGNPSSLHSMGFEAGNYIFDAREALSRTFPRDGRIVFTSGGTESDNMAIFSSCRKMRRRGKKVITTQLEHPAVLECMKRLQEDGYEIVYLASDVNGYVEPQALKAALDEETVLVSMMAVNNEVGTIEPVLPCYRIVQEFNREHGTEILFHTDGVQAFGKVEFNDAPFDLISISGHKFHGPKGSGALYIRKGINLPNLIEGGAQERNRRAGTENIPGIVGMAAALTEAVNNMEENTKKVAALRDRLIEKILKIPHSRLNGSRENRLPGNVSVCFEGVEGESMLL